MHESDGPSCKKYIVWLHVLVPCGNIHIESPSVDEMVENKSKHQCHMWVGIVYIVVGCHNIMNAHKRNATPLRECELPMILLIHIMLVY